MNYYWEARQAVHPVPAHLAPGVGFLTLVLTLEQTPHLIHDAFACSPFLFLDGIAATWLQVKLLLRRRLL